MTQLPHVHFPLRRRPRLLVDLSTGEDRLGCLIRGERTPSAFDSSDSRLHFGMLAGLRRNSHLEIIRLTFLVGRSLSRYGRPRASASRITPSLPSPWSPRNGAGHRSRGDPSISAPRLGPRCVWMCARRQGSHRHREPIASRPSNRYDSLGPGDPAYSDCSAIARLPDDRTAA